MSRRKANLEHEYKLEREISDLKGEIAKLKKKLREFEKADKLEPKEAKEKPKKPVTKECPKCGANVKDSVLPIGVLSLCSSACGYREMRKT